MILPKFSYAATVLCIPNDIRKSLNVLIMRFILPKGNMGISLIELAQKREFGGYNIDHVSIHASIFALLPIFKYVQNRVNDIPLTREQFFIEYNLGHQLSKLLQIPVNNRTPHRFTPMEPYAHILKLIRDSRITGEDLVKGRIKIIYEKCIYSQIKHVSCNWSRLHMKIFPNYLKTFNYKLSVDILPCKTKYVDFGLDTDSRCNFCSVHADTSLHLFSQCSVLRFVWELLDQVMITLGFRFRFLNAKRSNFIDLRNIYISKNEKKVVMYLNSVWNA